MKVKDLRVRDNVERGPRVRFTFDGQVIAAYAGESVAAALWAAGIRSAVGTVAADPPFPARGERVGATGTTNELAAATTPPYRVLFCMMGVCQQCVVCVDGARVEACRVAARDGMVVQSK